MFAVLKIGALLACQCSIHQQDVQIYSENSDNMKTVLPLFLADSVVAAV